MGRLHIQLSEILTRIRPGAEWNLDGETYEGLVWLDKVQVKPTKEEIEAEMHKD